MTVRPKWTELASYQYDLPEQLIAQYPVKKRDNARLMVVDRGEGKIIHDRFDNIGQYLPQHSLIILNDSKVIPARLIGYRPETGGRVEVFVLRHIKDGLCETLMKPMRRLKDGDVIKFPGARVKAVIKDRDKRLVEFSTTRVLPFLYKHGRMPLPPYVKRESEAADIRNYQTVYAKKAGSVAAPTAGMHFTKPLMNKLKRSGHEFQKVTLHINYGTFKPVESADIKKHPMHTETYDVSPSVASQIKKARKSHRPVVAVGTTACRTLESMAATGRRKGSTNLFIYPGFDFRSIDCLVTNFHLPFSTLLMLVYAFGRPELMQKAYKEAVREKYRFYSYGDGMIII